MILALLAILVVTFLLIEAARAARNERTQIARGGIEPAGDVYNVMRVAYPASFLALLIEGAIRASASSLWFVPGMLIFAAAKALKWWAIIVLGRQWTFRVIVVPNDELVTRGPYRWLRHPNYLAVAGEFAGVALMCGAWITGSLTLAIFSTLMLRRITVEERALGAILRRG